jgi:hypothetical protein
MPEYEITSVAPDPKPWKAQGKFDMVEYRVDLRGPNSEGAVVDVQNVEWSRKAESQAPTVGQRLNVEKFENRGPRGLKLHLIQQGFPTGSHGSSRDSREYKADPVKQAAIAMEASQKAAVEIVRIGSEESRDPESVLKDVQRIASSLFEQIQQAMKDTQ